MLGPVVEPVPDRRLVVVWCVVVTLLTGAITGVAVVAASVVRATGLMTRGWTAVLVDGPWLASLAGSALLALGLGAQRLGARRSLRAGLALVLLGGGGLLCEVAVWPEVIYTPRPARPGELGGCGNALEAATWSFWLAWLLRPPAALALVVAVVAWARDARVIVAAGPRALAGEAAVVAFLSGPILLGLLPLLADLGPAPDSPLLVVDSRTASAATLLLVIPLGVAAARALLRAAPTEAPAPGTP